MVVAGGGMVGMAMACSLGQTDTLADQKIVVLEGGNPQVLKQMPAKYSNRVSTLNPASKELLVRLGVWDDMTKMRVQPVKKMQVWESCSDALITYHQSQMQDDVAYVVENDVLVSALLKRISSMAERVEVLANCSIEGYEVPPVSTDVLPSLVGVKLKDGRHLRAKLLIGADGPKSMVRQAMGVKYIQWSYGQEAVVATVHLSEPTQNIVAWQRFLPTGPVALLPLNDRLSSLVWTTTPSKAKELCNMSNESFVDNLNAAFWTRSERLMVVDAASKFLHNLLQTVVPYKTSVHQLPPSIEGVEDGSRASFPLGLGHSTEYVRSRMAVVGDAAHRVHPLAGLGVNLGLGDVQVLTDVLEKSVYDGNDIGMLRYLAQYEKERQWHVVPTMAAIDGLNRLYSTRQPALVLLRTLGLQITDACPPLKERIVTHASA